MAKANEPASALRQSAQLGCVTPDKILLQTQQGGMCGPSGAQISGLKNCANSLHVCGVNRVFCANKINNLATENTGCESCRPSQAQAKVADCIRPLTGVLCFRLGKGCLGRYRFWRPILVLLHAGISIRRWFRRPTLGRLRPG